MNAPRPALALNLAAGLLATLVATVLWTLERLKYPIAQFLAEGSDKSGLPRFALGLLGPADFTLFAIAAGLAGVLGWLEFRHAALSTGLREAPRPAFALLAAALFAWCAHAYLHPGILLAGDTAFHVARMHHFRLGLEQGQLLFWDNYFNIGVPELQFTGPLLFWSGGLLDLLVRDPYLATKLLLFALHAGSGWAMYCLLRRVGIAPVAALAGAFSYAGAFAWLHLMLYRGSLPQAYTLLFLPLGFLLLERVTGRGEHLSTAWSALAIASGLIMINHPSNGMFVGLYMALMVAGSLLTRRYPWSRSWPAVTAGASGVLLMLFILIPVLVEKTWVTMQDAGPLVFLQLPEGSFWRHIVTWSNAKSGSGGNFDAYLGVSVLLLALAGAWAAWRPRHDGADARFFRVASVLLLLAPVLAGPHVRTIMFVMFFVALLAGFGAHHLLAKRPRGHAPALVLAVLLLDLGTTAVQPLARTDKGYFAEGARYLIDRYPNERILESASYRGELFIPIWGGSPLLVQPLQQLGLPFGYSATVFHNYGALIAKDAERELAQQGRLSESTARALAMLNFSRIVNDGGRSLGMPAAVAGAVPDGPLGRVVRVPAATPIVLAARVTVRDPDPAFDRPVLWDEDFASQPRVEKLRSFVHGVLRGMEYDSAAGTASVIPVRGPARETAGPAERPGRWAYRVLDYQVAMSRVSLRLESDRGGYLQLAHAWYASQQVRHNGQVVEPLRGTFNLLVLPVSPGVNDYEIVPVRSALRRQLGAFCTALFVVLVGVGIWSGRRRTAGISRR